MRTRKNPLARLDQAARAAQSVLAQREAARSEERLALLAGWKSRPASAGIPEGVSEEERERIAGEEEDFPLGALLDAQFAQYQKEKKERKENGEPEKPLEPPCPPVRLF